MHNISALIPIKGGFIITPTASSARRKEDVSRQSTLQCENGCPSCNKIDEPSSVECFIGTTVMFVGLIWSGFCLYKTAGWLYDIFNKPSDKE